MNKALLEQAVQAIEAQPKHFNMCDWVTLYGDSHPEAFLKVVKTPPTCGTAFCLAGWVVHEAIKQGFVVGAEGCIGDWAIQALGATGTEEGALLTNTFYTTSIKTPAKLRNHLVKVGLL